MTTTTTFPKPKRQPAVRRRYPGIPRALTPAQTVAVKKIVEKQADTKYTDFTDSVGVSTAGHIFHLTSNLARGDDGLNGFEGNIIKPKGLTVRYFFAVENISHGLCRCIIFQWNDDNSPALSDVIQDAAAAASVLPMQPTEISRKSVMKVLHDDLYYIVPYNGVAANTQGAISTKIYVPGYRMRTIRFNPSSSAITCGAIYMLVLSDDATTPGVAAGLSSRLSYTD